MAHKLMIASRLALSQPRVVVGASGLACTILAQLIAAMLVRSV